MGRSLARPPMILGLWIAVLATRAAAGAPELVPDDLAHGKPATASSTQAKDLSPAAANDANPQTRWCASDGTLPQWWQVDLHKAETLTGCQLVWEFERDAHRFKLEGSADGMAWQTLVDHSQEGVVDDGQYKFSARDVRYVRLTVSGIDTGHWASLFDIEIYGTKMIAARSRPKRLQPIKGDGLLAGIKIPPGFRATLFAAPPDVHYPTCLAAAPTGEVFVGIDENGSIDAKSDRGRIVRCVDRDGDGKADQFNVFARMDSPRGLVYDAGTLYVLHPPFLSAYHDDNGDGVSDHSEVLVKGIGFDLKFRGADHTTNGIQLGIDGWLYVAVGDYGFVKAEGHDGTALQLRGGGIVRVRPDGTGLELFARGTRNIYDVAIDPLGNVFTRDNTNDGGGWNVRLSHIIASGNYGYPSLFTNFADEIVAPLADYGGGSPTGSLYVQDPIFPDELGDTLYTCDWGRSVVYRHPLTAVGAGFKAEQAPFVELPRPTDIDIDGLGRLYISTWSEGGFTYSGPNVGYVVRLTRDGAARSRFPDLKTETNAELIADLGGGTQVLRLHAQRELLRRADGAEIVTKLETYATTDAPRANRAAALYTLAQMPERAAREALIRLADRTDVREFALRALGDRKWEAATISEDVFTGALQDADARVRLQAVTALGRLNKSAAAATIVPLTADPDSLVSHAAIKSLVALRAVDAALAAIQPGDARRVAGACRVLQELPEKRSVEGLLQKLDGSRDDTYRRPILKALCRLHFVEAEWRGQWWGTRPDTSGPYYQPTAWEMTDRVARTLQHELDQSTPEATRWLLMELIRNKIDSESFLPLILRTASEDRAFMHLAADLLLGRPKLSPEVVSLFASAAGSDKEDASFRARLLRGLERHADQPDALEAVVQALAPVGAAANPNGELLSAWRDFVRDDQHRRRVDYFVKAARADQVGRAELAYAVLVGLSRRDGRPARARTEAANAIAAAWKQPPHAAALLRAIGLLQEAAFAADVRSRLESDEPAVKEAARFAAHELRIEQTSRQGPTLAKLPYDQIVSGAVKEHGDASLGAQLFQRQGCTNCHTIATGETLKGPLLAGISARYNRTELIESILKPSARIAQGFETQKFATTDGRTFDGFVVRESGEEVEFRTGNGSVTVLKKSEIDERGKSELSVMPNGLGDPLTIHDLASILAYLESLKAK